MNAARFLLLLFVKLNKRLLLLLPTLLLLCLLLLLPRLPLEPPPSPETSFNFPN